jgi:AmmeMemoRadiSam system protein B
MTRPQPQTVRRSVIAGSWYPGTQDSLARTVDGYLASVDPQPIPGELAGLISPHAGYAYSGQTAAYAYRQLEGRRFDTVVLLGPSHRAWVGDFAVSTEDAYETPLGLVPLDQAFIADLAQRVTPRRVQHDGEHSLEIQLPFLQRQMADFALVPIMMNADEPAVALAQPRWLRRSASGGRPAGRPCSSQAPDLHHIDSYQQVIRRDRPIVDAIAAYDLDRLTPLLMDRVAPCATNAVLTVCTLPGTWMPTRSGSCTTQFGRRDGPACRRPCTVGYGAAVYRSE